MQGFRGAGFRSLGVEGVGYRLLGFPDLLENDA